MFTSLLKTEKNEYFAYQEVNLANNSFYLKTLKKKYKK